MSRQRGVTEDYKVGEKPNKFFVFRNTKVVGASKVKTGGGGWRGEPVRAIQTRNEEGPT